MGFERCLPPSIIFVPRRPARSSLTPCGRVRESRCSKLRVELRASGDRRVHLAWRAWRRCRSSRPWRWSRVVWSYLPPVLAAPGHVRRSRVVLARVFARGAVRPGARARHVRVGHRRDARRLVAAARNVPDRRAEIRAGLRTFRRFFLQILLPFRRPRRALCVPCCWPRCS